MSIDKGSHPIKPNPHPYAIKTTSTALLSRSSSIPSSTASAPYYYVPTSPSPSPTKAHAPRPTRHRYSRSLTSNDPRPLPVPPGDSTPLVFNSPQGPKQWTPEQLANFLEEKIPGEEVRDLVMRHEIGGRAFLRFDDGVLDAYGVPQTLQPALLSAARALKQQVLHGRINPFSTDSTPSRQSLSRSANSSPTRPITIPRFSSSSLHDPEDDDPAYLSSSSSVSSTSSLRNLGNGDPDGSSRRRRRARRDGRVHGIVASLERSGSVDEGHSPTRSSQGSPTRALNASPTRFSASPTRGLYTRDRSDSASTNGTDDEPGNYHSGYGVGTSRYDARGRPLPFPPAEHQLQYAVAPGSPSKNPPLLLPRTGVVLGSPQNTGGSFGSMENTPQHTGTSVGGRPLPLPPNGGFVPVPVDDGSVFGSEKSVYESAHSSPTGSATSGHSGHSGVRMSRGRRKDSAGRGSEEELSVDDILASLGAGSEKMGSVLDAVGEDEMYKADGMGVGVLRGGLKRRGRVRKTSSQVPPRSSDEDMTMEELLALEGDGKGAEAWEMDLGMGETVKRVPGGAGKVEARAAPNGTGSTSPTASPTSELGELSGSSPVAAETVKALPSPPPPRTSPPTASLRPRTLATGSMRLSEPILSPKFSPPSISKGTQDRLSMPGPGERLSMTSRTRGRKLKVKEGRDRRGVVDVFGHEVHLLGSSDGGIGEHGELVALPADTPQPAPQEEKSLPLPPTPGDPNAGLAQMLDERNSEVEALKQEVGALKKELVVLREETGTLREDAGTLRTELGTTKEELGVAQTNVAESLAEVTTLRADLVASKSVATALEAEVVATRGVAEAFRKRIGEMEERVRASEESRVKANEAPEIADPSLKGKLLKNLKVLALAWSISVPGLSGLLSTTTNTALGPTANTNGRARRRHNIYDPRQSPLPRYVLLVGIGMCAFVLRGIVRRMWGLGGVGALGGRAVRGVGGVGVRR